MTSNPISHAEVDERAFANFLMDGIYYLLQQDIPLHHEYIINFCNNLWRRWRQMSDNEKDMYWERAMEELRRIRRYSNTHIYRDVMRDADPNRRFHDRSS